MLITEYIVPMPLSCEEYERGLLYGVIDTSMRESVNGTGIEIIANEPFENYPLLGEAYAKGQYTKKIYHVGSTAPRFLSKLAPKSAMTLCEESWNAFPYCRTILTNDLMGDNFYIRVDTLHVDNNRGDWINAHQLDKVRLRKREVVHVDIREGSAHCLCAAPCRSELTGRGPLERDWLLTAEPVMTCYKLVTIHFKWFGLQSAVERYIASTQHKLCVKLHKRMFCQLDQWITLTIDDIRKLEDKAQEELLKMHLKLIPRTLENLREDAGRSTPTEEHQQHTNVAMLKAIPIRKPKENSGESVPAMTERK